jgi:NADH-quinone oxidoreductase subunit L
MDTSLALLLLLAPFIGFFYVFLRKSVGKSASGIIRTLTVAVSFAASVYFFMQINKHTAHTNFII